MDNYREVLDNLEGKMHKYLKENSIGCFKIERKEATEDDVKYYKLQSAMNGSYGEYYGFKPGIYTRLIYNNHDVVMSDTSMEMRTNHEFVSIAHGNVLIAGLGLGIILLAIKDKPEIKMITVIEKYDEVIELVAKQLPLNGKVRIIKGDILEWLPIQEIKFDTIYFDIWTNIGGDNYPQMKELHRKFRKYLNKNDINKWMSSWRYDDCKRMNYADNKEDRERKSFDSIINGHKYLETRLKDVGDLS